MFGTEGTEQAAPPAAGRLEERIRQRLGRCDSFYDPGHVHGDSLVLTGAAGSAEFVQCPADFA
jgi:hypothetical protein